MLGLTAKALKAYQNIQIVLCNIEEALRLVSLRAARFDASTGSKGGHCYSSGDTLTEHHHNHHEPSM